MGLSLDPATLRLSPLEAMLGAWLLTYVVHATLLVVAVALVTKWRRVRSDALREMLWKCALVGGVLTTTVQLAAGGRLVGDLWTVAGSEEAHAVVPADARVTLPGADDLARRDIPADLTLLDAAPTALATTNEYLVAGEAGAAPTTGRGVALLLLLTPAALGLLVLAWRWRRFHRSIARRAPLTDGNARRTLEHLRARAGLRRRVRLSASDTLTVPVAFGILRPEICLPTRALHELGAPSLEGMLAHELAHHVRRDPLWLTVWRVGEALFFVQPLNRWARRRWQELAEYRADAMAARLVGNGLPLARCLTEVAVWMVEARRHRQSVLAPGMAERRSGLERRIARLCAARDDSPDRPRPWHALAAGALLVLAALVAPGFAAHSAAAESNLPFPVAPASTRTPAPLPLPEALGALGDELEALQDEVDAFGRTVREQGGDPELERLLGEIAARSRGLRTRRLEIEEQGSVAPSPKQESNPRNARPTDGR